MNNRLTRDSGFCHDFVVSACLPRNGGARLTIMTIEDRPDHKAKSAAMAAGEKTYRSERPCKIGHLLRYVKGGSCAECVRIRTTKFGQENPAYHRELHKSNPETPDHRRARYVVFCQQHPDRNREKVAKRRRASKGGGW